MCGISGIIDLVRERNIDCAALARMHKALIHRGPDGEGVFIEPGIGLAHRRLAIIDIAGGVQPFKSHDRASAITYNGEIYNHDVLRTELKNDGVQFNTNSDTEVLVEGLQKHGHQYLHKLRGMFAFANWNRATKRLILARDRLGERPLYYAITKNKFLVFASELNALMASGLTPRNYDNEAIADYFHYGFVPDPKSIFEGVFKLPPGHILHATRGKPTRLERYWRPVFAASANIPFEDAASILKTKLDDAVKAQLVSDAPLGAFLSGGIDSAGIVASMHNAGKPLLTCTMGFDDREQDERVHAREIATKFGSTHHEETVTVDATSLIDKIAGIYGEPFADSSALNSYLVAQMASKHVKVAISGDGGDEVFAGYRRYRFYLQEEKYRALAPQFLRQPIFSILGALYPKLDNAPQFLRAKTTLLALSKSRAYGYADALAINLPSAISKIFSTEFKKSLNHYHPGSVIETAMADANTDDALSAAQYADLMTWLPGRMLTKVDRASMAHSLEVRPPLLDHQLIEWAGMLPPSYKLEDANSKRVLKAALSSYLSPEYMARPKQGFEAPIENWLKRKENNPINRLDQNSKWRESGIFDEDGVGDMIRRHRTGTRNYSQELWSLVMFDAFLRQAG